VLALRDVPWAKLGLGKVLFAEKKYAVAAQTFRDLIDSNPDMTVAMDWLARCYQMLGESGDARGVVQTALELSPKAILRQLMFGDLSLQTGDFVMAEKAYDEAVHLGRNSVHNHPSVYARLAKSRAFQEKHGEALNAIKQINKTFGKDKDAEFYTATSEALVYHNQGDTERAEEAIARASKLYEHGGAPADNELTLELAQVASYLDDSDKANELLKSAILNNHDDDEFLQSVTATLRDAGLSDSPEEYVAQLRKEVVEMNNRGVQMLQQNQLNEAVDLFREAAVRMAGNRTINLNAARAMLKVMETRGADTDNLGQFRQYLDRLKRVSPDDVALKPLLSRLQKVIANA